jgi:hypothetical protein
MNRLKAFHWPVVDLRATPFLSTSMSIIRNDIVSWISQNAPSKHDAIRYQS